MHISRSTWLFSIFLILCYQLSVAQNIVINEFMADNESSILDDYGELSDWIELYNPGTNSIDLYGYHLTDDKDDLRKWTFPSIEIGAKQFLIIFASGKDKHNNSFLHTNFKISNDGEKLILSNSLEIKIDEFDKVKLGEDESFGRLPDGSSNKVILPSSSPGNSNNSINKLIFSHNAGFYNSTIDLSIESLLGDSVFYTIDGSDPTPESKFYKSKLTLENNSSAPNVWCEIPTTPAQELISNPAWQSPDLLVDKANIIRCASFRNGFKTSETYTRTYLIDSEVFEKYDMPIVSLITDGDNLFDHNTGIYVPGTEYDPDNPEWTGNYFTDEVESERSIHIEYFEKDGTSGFNQNAGVRIHGGKTRHAAQKSLKLYARKEYGNKYFRYPLMPKNGVDKYERFLLQTTMAAWGGETVIKDVLAHEIVNEMDLEKMDYQPVVVFLNGEYWGIHHIRDRIDEEYLSYTTGLDKDSLQIYRWNSGHYTQLVNYFKDNVPLDDPEYGYISTQMDIDGFIDYNIAEMFLKNYDWPINNTRHWKPKNPEGKWRWIFFDIDAGFGDYNYNMLEHNTNTNSSITWPNGPKSTFFFRSLIENELFLEKFLKRYKFLIEDDFRSSITKEKLNALINQYKYEMPKHIERWHFPASFDSWLSDIDTDLAEFLDKRSCLVVEHLREFFDLENYEVDCSDAVHIVSHHNEELGIIVAPNPNEGHFSLKNSSQNRLSIDITLYNALGQVSYQTYNLAIEAYGAQTFTLNHLVPGVYMLKMRHGNISSTIPMIIVNN